MQDSKNRIEELLEALWTDSEEVEGKHKALLTAPHQFQPLLAEVGMEEALHEAEVRGLVVSEGQMLRLTEEGMAHARNVVRCHRLAERLFHDVLDIGGDEAESSACHIEHLLSLEAADSICIMLGHPTVCPHGKPIPGGDCCEQKVEHSRPLVVPATQLRTGEEATIAYLSAGARGKLEQLSAMGLVPGTKVSLQQRAPSYVLSFGQTQIALDQNVLKDVYVKRLRVPQKITAARRRWAWRNQ